MNDVGLEHQDQLCNFQCYVRKFPYFGTTILAQVEVPGGRRCHKICEPRFLPRKASLINLVMLATTSGLEGSAAPHEPNLNHFHARETQRIWMPTRTNKHQVCLSASAPMGALDAFHWSTPQLQEHFEQYRVKASCRLSPIQKSLNLTQISSHKFGTALTWSMIISKDYPSHGFETTGVCSTS